MSRLFDLTGKVAVVTGATKGVGLGIAASFVEHGARVVVGSRTPADCEATAALLNDRSRREAAVGVPCDLLDSTSLRSFIDQAVSCFGSIDTLVCNAAHVVHGSEADTSPGDFVGMFEANVYNNYAMAELAAGHMRQAGGGSIIFISSMAGLRPSPSVAVYGIVKRAMLQLVQNLAVEWGRDGVRVNAIVPGLVRSESTRVIWESPEMLQSMIGDTPIHRIGEPEDIAAMAVLLASPGGSYVTGQAIVVDGGATLGYSYRGNSVIRRLYPGESAAGNLEK
jgi:NAD(P)-dependent dehydrogenase (short-subunit alcohol dehydrogenase family)